MGGDGTLLHASSLFQVSFFVLVVVDFSGLMWNQEDSGRTGERLLSYSEVLSLNHRDSRENKISFSINQSKLGLTSVAR